MRPEDEHDQSVHVSVGELIGEAESDEIIDEANHVES
jgi:hypothetical protein